MPISLSPGFIHFCAHFRTWATSMKNIHMQSNKGKYFTEEERRDKYLSVNLGSLANVVEHVRVQPVGFPLLRVGESPVLPDTCELHISRIRKYINKEDSGAYSSG